MVILLVPMVFWLSWRFKSILVILEVLLYFGRFGNYEGILVILRYVDILGIFFEVSMIFW